MIAESRSSIRLACFDCVHPKLDQVVHAGRFDHLVDAGRRGGGHCVKARHSQTSYVKAGLCVKIKTFFARPRRAKMCFLRVPDAQKISREIDDVPPHGLEFQFSVGTASSAPGTGSAPLAPCRPNQSSRNQRCRQVKVRRGVGRVGDRRGLP